LSLPFLVFLLSLVSLLIQTSSLSLFPMTAVGELAVEGAFLLMSTLPLC
jgi:hypothetical protein